MIHYPVMYTNLLKKLTKFKYLKKFRIADCNFGLGGHSHLILQQFQNAIINAYQLDPKVLQYYYNNYSSMLDQKQKERLLIHNCNYTQLAIQKPNIQYDVIFADLGYNSYQLDQRQGFSWKIETDLDMRYSQDKGIKKCSQIINTCSLLELSQILQKYGQVRQSMEIAKRIINARPIKTTFVLRDAVVGGFQSQKPRKLAQVFQAFRIATNGQLEDLKILCQQALSKLSNNGIMIIITFHSLQRTTIRNFAQKNKKLISKVSVEQPSKEQISQNSKSSSAKMYFFNKNVQT